MGPEEEEEEPEDEGYDVSVLKCMKARVYGDCPKSQDKLRVGVTAYVQASSAAVRPSVTSPDKVMKLHIGDAVRVLTLEKEWARVEGEGMKGWIELSVLGPRAPQVDQLVKTYHGIKPCADPSKGLDCDLDKLKERQKWAKRIAALQPENPMGVGLFVEALEQLLAAKIKGVFASKRARQATTRQLQSLRICLKARSVQSQSDGESERDCFDEAERVHEEVLRQAGN